MNGPFRNGFPYTNFHELNTDWLIQIAKDFLDQYSHIQETITSGETAIQETTEAGQTAVGETTTAGIESLQTEKTRLEGLLDAWYTQHSEDIAGELAQAISDFQTAAAAAGAEVIASIPADYSTLSASVTNIDTELTDTINTVFHKVIWQPHITRGKYISRETGIMANGNANCVTSSIDWDGWPGRNAIRMTSGVYKYALRFYDSTGDTDTGEGYLGGTGYASSGFLFIPKTYNNGTVSKIGINFSRVDGSNMSSSDPAAILANLETYKFTDEALTMDNVAADAKQTGIYINRIINIMNGVNPVTEDTWTPAAKAINYSNGSLLDSTSLLSHTDYIDVSMYKEIKYKQAGFTEANVSSGIAFYTKAKVYISGVKNKTGQDAQGYADELNTVSVPSTAQYVRCTIFTDTDTYGDFELYGYSHLNTDIIDSSNGISFAASEMGKQLKPYNYQTGSLYEYAINTTTGARTSDSTGKICSTAFSPERFDLELTLGLDEYMWHAWSYSSTDDSDATHSNTNQRMIDGTVPIFIKKHINDSAYIAEFRRKDGAILTTDTTDPDSDYSKILAAFKTHRATNTLPVAGYDGFIFRLENNPESIPIGSEALGYNTFISQTWDTFLTDYPDEVTKSVVGVSSTTDEISTEYDIYSYVFTPRDYVKTVFLSAGCHGNEYEGFWGLYRLMRMIWDEGYKYPNLRKLRHSIRFVIVPVWNPWGVENKERNCPLGFPPQENLNTSVTSAGETYPAFTSKECLAIKNVFDTYEGKLTLWVDLHTDPFSVTHTPPAKKGCYGYAADRSQMNAVLYALTVDFHNIIKDECDYTTNITIYNTNPSAYYRLPGYGIGRDVPSAVIETTINEYAESGTATIMKYAQEWYGNVIANLINAVN